MVALTKISRPLGGAGIGLEDQKLEANVEKLAPVEGQSVHPDVLENLNTVRADLRDWLSDAKAQLERSRQCIPVLTSDILNFCTIFLSGATTIDLPKRFAELKEQLEQDGEEISKVMDDFCRFSSGYSLKSSQLDQSLRPDKSAGVGVDTHPQLATEILQRVASLTEALKLTLPFIECMTVFYRADGVVYTGEQYKHLQQRDAEYLERASKLSIRLSERISVLDKFAQDVTETINRKRS